MVSRVQYELILKSIRFHMDQLEGTSKSFTQQEAQAAWDITHPYVVVIHKETGHGYFLDRKYQHVLSVRDIPVPTQWVERELNHQASSFTTPDWAQGPTVSSSDFNSYWLY